MRTMKTPSDAGCVSAHPTGDPNVEMVRVVQHERLGRRLGRLPLLLLQGACRGGLLPTRFIKLSVDHRLGVDCRHL